MAKNKKLLPDIIILEGWCVGATEHQKKSDLKKTFKHY